MLPRILFQSWQLTDAQYTPEQLAGERKGWGHSSWLEGTRIARECNVKHLMLFHDDPDHDDAFVDSLVGNARGEFPTTTGAAEGLEIWMTKGETRIVDRGVSVREPFDQL